MIFFRMKVIIDEGIFVQLHVAIVFMWSTIFLQAVSDFPVFPVKVTPNGTLFYFRGNLLSSENLKHV